MGYLRSPSGPLSRTQSAAVCRAPRGICVCRWRRRLAAASGGPWQTPAYRAAWPGRATRWTRACRSRRGTPDRSSSRPRFSRERPSASAMLASAGMPRVGRIRPGASRQAGTLRRSRHYASQDQPPLANTARHEWLNHDLAIDFKKQLFAAHVGDDANGRECRQPAMGHHFPKHGRIFTTLYKDSRRGEILQAGMCGANRASTFSSVAAIWPATSPGCRLRPCSSMAAVPET